MHDVDKYEEKFSLWPHLSLYSIMIDMYMSYETTLLNLLAYFHFLQKNSYQYSWYFYFEITSLSIYVKSQRKTFL